MRQTKPIRPGPGGSGEMRSAKLETRNKLERQMIQTHGKRRTKPIRAGRRAKRSQFQRFWAKNKGWAKKQSQFARVLAVAGNANVVASTPRQIGNANGHNSPVCAYQSQSGPAGAPNEANIRVLGLGMRVGRKNEANVRGAIWDWGFGAGDAWNVKRSQIAGGRCAMEARRVLGWM